MSFASIMSFFDPLGNSPGSSLNWSQHAALERAGRGVTVVARPAAPAQVVHVETINTEKVLAELAQLGQTSEDVLTAIGDLEANLGLRLDTQTTILQQQADTLSEIAHTLRNPAHTRSAERVRDAAALLGQHRYRRALDAAEEAVRDNPNSHPALVEAAWAHLGLERPDEGRDLFREAALATAGQGPDQDVAHLKTVLLAARLTFALDGPEAALRELDTRRTSAPEAELLQAHPWLASAREYDRAVYLLAAGATDAAVLTFRAAARRQSGYAAMALTDPMLADPRLHAEALEALRGAEVRRGALREEFARLERRFAELDAELVRFGADGYPDVAAYLHTSAPGWAGAGGRIAALNPRCPQRRTEAWDGERGWARAGVDLLQLHRHVDPDTWGSFEAAAAAAVAAERELATLMAPAIQNAGSRLLAKGPHWAVVAWQTGPRVRWNQWRTAGTVTANYPDDASVRAAYARAYAGPERYLLADGTSVPAAAFREAADALPPPVSWY